MTSGGTKMCKVELSISKKTMDSRLHSAVYKLGARNRTHAVAIALRNKLIE